MQKKILASLLVSPVAFNAAANITMEPVDNGAWTATGVTGTDIFKDGVVTCPIGTGVISQSYTIEAPGTYSITFANSNNAIFEVFSGDDKLASGESTVTFTMAKAGTIVLKVSAKNPAEVFLFGDATVEVIFDFDGEKTALETALNAANKYESIPADNTSEAAVALRKELRDLQLQVNELRARIVALPKEDGDNNAKLNAYKDEKLYEDPNPIEVEISQLAEEFTTTIEKIKAENDRYNTIKSNTVARDALLAEVTKLEADLKIVTDKIEAEDVSEAVKGECAENVSAARTAIQEYKSSIETAYADLAKKDITVESQKTVIEGLIQELDDKFNKAVADETALGNLAAMDKSLRDAYLKAQITITGFTGVKDHENVFAVRQAEWMKQISDQNEVGKAALADPDPDKAAANAEIVQGAIDGINAVVVSAQKLVDAQNAAMVDAQSAIGGVETAFNSQTEDFAKNSEGLTIATEVKDEYDKQVKAIEDAINAATEKVAAEYGKNDLTPDDYTSALNDIGNLIEELNTFLSEQNLVNKAEAQNALNDLKEYITEAQKDLDVDILGKFNSDNGTIPSIQEAINALTGENTEVMTAIETAKGNADKLISAFKGAKSAYDEFHAAIERLKMLVDNKIIVPGSKYDKTNGIDKTLDEFRVKDTKWEEAYTVAAGKNAQECYDAAVNLSNEMKVYDWESMIDDAFNTFENTATEANYQVAVDKLAAVKANADAQVAGDAFTDIDKTMAGIMTALDAAKADVAFDDEEKVDGKVKACADIDAAVAKAIADIDKIADNQTAYIGFVKRINEVQTEINDLIDFNNKTALSPALDYFANAINGVDNTESLQAKFDALKTQLDEYLAKITVVDFTEEINGDINGLKTKIRNMEAAIQANEDAHNAQLAKSQTARDVIASNLAEIQKDTDEALVAEWVRALEELRDTDLLDTDRAVTQAYAEGACDKSDAVNKYDEIIKSANGILAGYTDGYAGKVAENNAQIQANAGWDGKKENLRATYLDAISAYNAYRSLKNTGYKSYLTENDVFKSHAGIYDYNTSIRNLESEVTTAVTNANAEKKALTADEFKEMATDKADGMIAEMNAKVAEMKKGFNDAGVAYYALLSGKANDAITEAEGKLTEAGLTDQIDDILKDAKDKIMKAEDAYAKAMDPQGAKGENIGLDMDGIADVLDKVMPIDLQTCAMNKWNSEYDEACETFSALEKELGTYDYASDDVKNAQSKLFADARTDATTLNSSAVADKVLIDNLADYLAELNSYVADAQKAVSAVKESNDGNKENQDAYADYTDNVIPELGSKLEELKAFVNALGGTANVDVDAVDAAVKAVGAAVVANKSQLIEKKTDIDNLITAANTAIDNAYNSAFADEVSYLTNNLLQQAKVSFNNAKAADKDNANQVRLDEINTSLDKIISEVGKLPLAPSEEVTSAVFQKAALGFETEICDYIAELQKMYTPYDGETTVQGVLEELNKAVGDVQTSIDNAKATISDYEQEVKDEFDPQVGALESELSAIKTEFDAAGNTVIAQQDNYEKRIKEVADELAELEKDAAAKQVVAKQHADSNARYEVLKGEYDTLLGRLDALKSLLAEYGLENEKFGVCQIQDYLDRAIADLDAKKAEFTLDADSKLAYGQSADYLLNLNTLEAMKQHAVDLQTVANGNLTKVGDALAWNILPEVKAEISSKLSELRTAYIGLNWNITNFIPSDYAGTNTETEEGANILSQYIQQLESIAGDALDLIDKAESGRYYPGDLNANGRVDVGDIQTLISMIGEGVTYEELYNEDPVLACAADVTGDKILTVADVTALIDLALYGNSGRTFAMVRGTVQSGSSINAVLISETNGVRTYAVNLTNNEAFVAGQFDLKVESGAEIVSVYAGDRLASHELSTFDNAGQTRVIIASMENSQISGNEGTTVFVEVKGRSGVGIENVVFADENSQAYALGDKNPETSGIDNIYNSAKAVKEAIYDAAGRAMKSVRRGLNIIRHSDGSVTKELRK